MQLMGLFACWSSLYLCCMSACIRLHFMPAFLCMLIPLLVPYALRAPLTLFAASLLLASHVMSSMGIYLCVAPEYSVTMYFAILFFCTHLGFSVFTLPCVPLFTHLLACGCVQCLSGQYSSQVIQLMRWGLVFLFPCMCFCSLLPPCPCLLLGWACWTYSFCGWYVTEVVLTLSLVSGLRRLCRTRTAYLWPGMFGFHETSLPPEALP